MCTVPRKNGVFRVTHTVIKHFNACNVVQLHAAVAV